MPRDKGVAIALFGVGKAAHAPFLAQSFQVSACDEFMDVALVPHVENQFVLREIERRMQGEGELHYP